MNTSATQALTAWIDGIGLIAPGLPDWPTTRAVLRGEQPVSLREDVARARGRGTRTARSAKATAAVASLVLSLACWPGSFLGIPINAAILGLLRTRRSDRRYV